MWFDTAMYEQIVMSEWSVDPMKIETEWTSEYFNMMMLHYLQRKIEENKTESDSSSKDGKVETVESDSTMLSKIGAEQVAPYPNVIMPPKKDEV